MTPITREDLEMAAKAAGYELSWKGAEPQLPCITYDPAPHGAKSQVIWMPHEDDGDCARMCAAVGIDVSWGTGGVWAAAAAFQKAVREKYADHPNDKCAAWRYASVKLAAAVGRAM